MESFEDLITYFASGGDVFMCQIKLIVTYMFLQFVLAILSVLSDGMRSV